MGQICYQLEFQLAQVSRKQMWSMLSTPQGLSLWMDAKVNIYQGRANFLWNGGGMSDASVLIDPINKVVNFRWLHESGGFILKQCFSEITKELSLIIQDECDEDDYESNQQIWHRQVTSLQHQLGIYQ